MHIFYDHQRGGQIKILAEIKYQLRCNPIDYKRVKELQSNLKKLIGKKRRGRRNSVHTSSFDWVQTDGG